MQGHLGPRVGRVEGVGPDWLLASIDRPFEKGDRLLVEGPDGTLGHLEVRWIETRDGALLERAERSELVRLPAPARRQVRRGAELRLAHSASIRERFAVRPPTLLLPDREGPAVLLELRTDEANLTVRAQASGVRIERTYKLGPEPVDVLRAPTIEEVFGVPDASSTLGSIRCVVSEGPPLRTPRKALRRARRDILRRLELAVELAALEARYPAVSAGNTERQELTTERWILRSDQPELLPLGIAHGYDGLEVALDPFHPERLARALDAIDPDTLTCALPPVPRSTDRRAIGDQIRVARSHGVRRWVVSNLGQSALVDAGPGEILLGDDLLYAANPMAAEEALRVEGLTSVTLPLELDRTCTEAMLATLGTRCTVVLYSDVAVFRSALPPSPRQPLADGSPLLDELDHAYFRAREGGTHVLVDGTPLCLSEHLEELRGAGASSFRVDLRWRDYDVSQAERLLERLRRGMPVPGTTTGNWSRTWL